MRQTRASRTLIGLVIVTIVLGSIAYFSRPGKTAAGDPNKGSNAGTTAGANPNNSSGNAVAPPAAPAQPPGPALGSATRPTQIALGGARPLIGSTGDGPRTITPPPPAAGGSANPPAAGRTAAATIVPLNPPAPVKSTGNALADGKALLDSNNLLAARKVLNEALTTNQLSPSDAGAAREMIAKANETLISARRVSDDSYSGTHVVQSGEKPLKIAAAHDVTWDFLGRINGIADPRRLRAGSTIKTVRGPFHAVVSKSKYTLDLYLGSPGEKGSLYVRTFKIGHGKDNSTPTGTWMVAPQSKLKNPKWWGTADEPAREADDPQNPLGEFWIGLSGVDGEAVGKQGFGIHGTIEPASIGKEASHGCVRMLNTDVQQVFEVLMEGKSTVIIRE